MLLGEENVHVVNFAKNMTFLRSWVVEDNNLNYCCEEDNETQDTSHKNSKEEEKID